MEIIIGKCGGGLSKKTEAALKFLYRYHRQSNNAHQKNLWLAIIQKTETRKRRLTYIFYKLIKEVTKLVKLL